MKSVINYHEGAAEERQMATGLHRVHDIYCNVCKSILGWHYEKAYEQSQKYKEGKFVLEVNQISELSDVQQQVVNDRYQRLFASEYYSQDQRQPHHDQHDEYEDADGEYPLPLHSIMEVGNASFDIR